MQNNIITVLFIVHRINIGGAEQRLLDFLNFEANNKKFLFYIICLREKGTIGDEISQLGLPIAVVKGKRTMHKLLNLALLLKRKRPDIIHIHLKPARLYTLFIKFFSMASLVYTIECQQRRKSNMERRLERLFYTLTDKIVAVSKSVKKFYCDDIKVNGKKIITIYNGVNICHFLSSKGNSFRKELGFSNQDIIISTVARLSKTKGHIYLARAANYLKDKYPSVKFIIVGDGKDKDIVINEINRLKLKKLFIFTGYRRDICNILDATDIFVLPSLNEAQGIAILEAMAAGKAIITTNIKGIDEVANENNCLLVPPGNSFLLAKRIEELILDKDRRLRIAEEARKYVTQKFSINSMSKNYEQLYCELYNRKKIR